MKAHRTRLLYPLPVCVDVLWQLQSLNLFSALAGGRARRTTAPPRRRPGTGVFSVHAYLFLTVRVDTVHFWKIMTDELKEQPHHQQTATAALLTLY